MFQPDRLKLIRLAHANMQADYAEKIGVTRQFINQIEGGDRAPNEETLNALCQLTGTKPSYFDRPITVWIAEAQCNFRKQKTTSKAFANQVIARATLVSEFLSWLANHIELPAVSLPHVDLSRNSTPENAAEKVRTEWSLGEDAPIDSVTRTLENAGVICVSATGISEKISALSVDGRRPIVLHNGEYAQPTRLRFDMAHEFGHLVMHRGMTTGDDETEEQADQFAAALLMPKKAFAREFPKSRSGRFHWPGLVSMKKRWGVSLRAVVRRAYSLGLIDAVQYKSGNVYLNSRGWAKSEPYEPNEPETPESLPMAVSVLRDHLNIYGDEISEVLGVSAAFLEELLGLSFPTRLPHRTNVVSLKAYGGLRGAGTK